LSIALCLILFSFFAHRQLLWALLFLFAGQVLMLISLSSCSWSTLGEIFGISKGRYLPLWALLSATAAIIAAVVYRRNLPYTPWLAGLTSFAGIAVLIGACEELIFRGFFYSKLPAWHFSIKALVSSIIHTCYKAALFVSFTDTRLDRLILWTLFTGVLLGMMRASSKSIIPCIIFHCLFDLLVYGDVTRSPWWVW